MAWAKNGTPNTLTGAADVITISNLTAKKFNVFLWHQFETGGSALPVVRFNNDNGTKYAYRDNLNGGTDATAVSQTELNTALSSLETFTVMYVISITGEEKLAIYHMVDTLTAGAGTAPRRQESVGKYVPSPDASITRYDVVNTDAGDMAIGSNLSVLGTD